MMAWNLAQFAQVGIGKLSHPQIVGMKAFHHRILGEAQFMEGADGGNRNSVPGIPGGSAG